MLKYKFDVLECLKDAGYSTYRLRQEKLLSESTLTKIRSGVVVSAKPLDVICKLLDMQPGNIIKYIDDDPKKN